MIPAESPHPPGLPSGISFHTSSDCVYSIISEINASNFSLVKSSLINRQTNTATAINIILILHIAITSIPPMASPPGRVPIDCQVLSGPCMTVSFPVWGSTDTDPSIMLIITVISTGPRRAQARRI